MPSSPAARRMCEDKIPSLTSVFGLGSDNMVEPPTVALVDSVGLAVMSPAAPGLPNHTCRPGISSTAKPPNVAAHRHHDSTATRISESTDSSPTTTLSMTDSSSISPSSSSSPDSPVNLIPLANYPATTFACQAACGSMLSIPETGAPERPMTSPAPRRPRNMKGLSIQPPASLIAPPRNMATEPSSPIFTFIKPQIPSTKRKPSQLSLKTGTLDLVAKTSMEMPASPLMPPILHRRALKHSTSSPHMMAGPRCSNLSTGGAVMVSRVLERNESGLSKVLRPTKLSEEIEMEEEATSHDESPIKTQLAQRNDQEAHGGNTNNEDQKSPSYPNGPVAMYGDQVFLYMEPTAEEASRFDVVLNVAREVKSPFDAAPPPRSPLESESQAADSPVPDTAITTNSYATALEQLSSDETSSTMDVDIQVHTRKIPEYIHVPWDHNTNIAPDLMRLCELIDSRVKQGKKVLIHCQQGASRSASLVIAYGLYQNPDLSLNDAYYAAQAKSRWISPSMKLMYALQDFHKELTEKRRQLACAPRPSRTSRSPTKHRLTLSSDTAGSTCKEPRTAPLPGNSVGADDSQPDYAMQHAWSGSAGSSSTGPASAPLTTPWKGEAQEKPPKPSSAGAKTNELPARPKSNSSSHRSHPYALGASYQTIAVQAATTLLPHQKLGHGRSNLHLSEAHKNGETMAAAAAADSATMSAAVFTTSAASTSHEPLMSPRAETMTTNPLHSSLGRIAGMRFDELPAATPTADLFSPRDAMFPRGAFPFFGRTTSFGRPTAVADPRSPPTRGEAPIVRSIDDVM